MLLALRRAALAVVCLFSAALVAGQEPPRSVDRILAAVDGDPILASEVDRAVGLGLDSRRAGESDRDFRRRVLDGLIEQRLRMHEVDRFGFSEVPAAEVDRALARVRGALGDEAAYQRRLREVQLDDEGLRLLVRGQLLVLAYVEERVGPRVFVGLEDIRAYYDATLIPELRRRGEVQPPLDEVREQIRGVLREQRLTEEIGRWTAELRAQAVIEDHFDREAAALPPLKLEIRAKG